MDRSRYSTELHRQAGSLFNDSRVQNFLDNVDAQESIEDLNNFVNSDGEPLGDVFHRTFRGLAFVTHLTLLYAHFTTLFADRWAILVHEPKIFRSELDLAFRSLKKLVRDFHEAPGHRPVEFHERDRELWLFKRKNPECSWKEIGLAFQISADAAHLAYKRQLRSERKKARILAKLANLIREIYDWLGAAINLAFGNSPLFYFPPPRGPFPLPDLCVIPPHLR